MKIVYCIPSLHNSGGMERVLTQKANHLADLCNCEVSIITTSQAGRTTFYPLSDKVRIIDLDIDYESIMKLPIIKRIKARLKARKLHKRKLSKTLNELKPDITVSMFTHEMSFLPTIKDGSKKILELHFSKSFRTLDANSNQRSLIYRLINFLTDIFDRRHIIEYEKFIVLTHRDAADWGKKYVNLYVIPNPVSVTPHQITDSSQKRALAVGRLCAQKGFDLLINAWDMIAKDVRKGWTLDILGSGPDETALRELIVAKGLQSEISILTPLHDISSIYLNHSIYCFSSRYEGFGLSLMEAMAFGLAPVSFDCPCGPSEVIQDGINGFLVAQNDTSKYAKRISMLMNDYILRAEMGKKASKTILDNYSEETVMKLWKEQFKSIY